MVADMAGSPSTSILFVSANLEVYGLWQGEVADVFTGGRFCVLSSKMAHANPLDSVTVNLGDWWVVLHWQRAWPEILVGQQQGYGTVLSLVQNLAVTPKRMVRPGAGI